MPKYALPREDGLRAYVITEHCWGRSSDRIEWATSLKEAKASHGWTLRLYTSVSVRRATPEDLAVTP